MTETVQKSSQNIFLPAIQQSISKASSLLKAAQENALEDFTNLGLPAAKHEEYKFIPLSKNFEKLYSGMVSGPTVAFDIPKEIEALDGYKLLFFNGELLPGQASVDELKALGLNISPIAKALENNEQAQALFNTQAQNANDGFAALNTALFNRGYYFNIGKSKVIEKPIYLIQSYQAEQDGNLVVSRNLFFAETNSEAKLVEIILGGDEKPVLLNHLSEVFTGQNAHLNFYKLELAAENFYSVFSTNLLLDKPAVFNHFNLSLGEGIIRNNLNYSLSTEHLEAGMFGFYFPTNKAIIDNHTAVDHKVANCQSNELYKGILDGQSTGVFNGKIFVRPNAQKTNAFQSNNNVVLSDSATINTKPQLEIWADDVKCSHGCTTGQLDDEALFYLKSRGIDGASARVMLLKAFAGEVLDKIQIADFKVLLEQIIEHKLN
jgi:Fe-S cluster assembly protein SufD